MGFVGSLDGGRSVNQFRVEMLFVCLSTLVKSSKHCFTLFVHTSFFKNSSVNVLFPKSLFSNELSLNVNLECIYATRGSTASPFGFSLQFIQKQIPRTKHPSVLYLPTFLSYLTNKQYNALLHILESRIWLS